MLGIRFLSTRYSTTCCNKLYSYNTDEHSSPTTYNPFYVPTTKHTFLCSISVDGHNASLYTLSLQEMLQTTISDGDSGARGGTLQLSNMS